VGASGFHIDKYSFITSEKEVLLEPGLSFTVRSIIPGPTNIVEIEYNKDSERMLINEIPQQGETEGKDDMTVTGAGRVETKMEMGIRYCGSKKFKKAMEAFKDAFKEDSSAMAAINMGYLYIYGLGVEKDIAEGLKMWSKAGKEAKDTSRSDWRKDPCVFSSISSDVLDLHSYPIGKRDGKMLASLIELGAVPPSLVLYDTCLSSEQLSLIFTSIKNSKTVTSVDISFNSVTSDCANNIFSSVDCLDKIKTLILSHNDLDDDATDALLSLIAQGELQTLDISDNDLTDASLKDIFEELEGNTTITSLNVGSNECSSSALTQLGKTLSCNTTLTSLEICSCKIPSDLPEPFIKGLKNMSSLTSLNLGNNSLEDDGLISISEALTGNDSLTELNLCSNGITDASMEQMSGFLSDSAIKIINLSLNNLGDEGAKKLMEGIKSSKTLSEIYLQSIGISNTGKDALSEIPKTKKKVKKLSFW